MSNSDVTMRSFPCRVRRDESQTSVSSRVYRRRPVILVRLNAGAVMDKKYLPTAEMWEYVRPNPQEYKIFLSLIRSTTSACKDGADLEKGVRKLTDHLNQLTLIRPVPRHCLHLMDEAFDGLIELMRQKGLSERVEWWREMLSRYFEVFELH